MSERCRLSSSGGGALGHGRTGDADGTWYEPASPRSRGPVAVAVALPSVVLCVMRSSAFPGALRIHRVFHSVSF